MNDERNLMSVRENCLAATGAARARLTELFDEGTFVELDALLDAGQSGVVTGFGLIDGRSAYAWAQEASVRGGAMGQVQARKICKLYDLALSTGNPVIALADSVGARLDEGMSAVNAYAEIMKKASALSGVVPQVTAVLGVCAGGAALCASMADLIVMGPKGKLYAATPGLRQAAGKAAFDGAEAAAQSGAACLAAKTDSEALAAVREIVGYLPGNNLDTAPFVNADAQNAPIPQDGDVRALISAVSDEPAFELYAESEKDAVTALGRVGGETVGFVGAHGKLTPAACRKIAGFVRLMDSYSLPVVTFVDTEGSEVADCEACAMKASAALAAAYMTATVARVSVICGKAVSSVSAALASRAAADCAVAWPDAVISALPTPAATQLCFEKELHEAADPVAKRGELEQKYEAETANPVEAALRGDIDDVIDPETTRAYVARTLTMLSGKRASLPAKKHGCLPM